MLLYSGSDLQAFDRIFKRCIPTRILAGEVRILNRQCLPLHSVHLSFNAEEVGSPPAHEPPSPLK